MVRRRSTVRFRKGALAHKLGRHRVTCANAVRRRLRLPRLTTAESGFLRLTVPNTCPSRRTVEGASIVEPGRNWNGMTSVKIHEPHRRSTARVAAAEGKTARASFRPSLSTIRRSAGSSLPAAIRGLSHQMITQIYHVRLGRAAPSGTSSATPSNAESSASNSTAPLPPATTSSPHHRAAISAALAEVPGRDASRAVRPGGHCCDPRGPS